MPVIQENLSPKFPSIWRRPATEGNFRDRFYVRLCTERKRRRTKMKGYYAGNGYYGYVDGRYVLFSSESDYYEMMEDEAA